MIDFIELTQGGEKHIIFTRHILLLKEHGKGCDIFVKDLDEPFYIDKPVSSVLHEITNTADYTTDI